MRHQYFIIIVFTAVTTLSSCTYDEQPVIGTRVTASELADPTPIVSINGVRTYDWCAEAWKLVSLAQKENEDKDDFYARCALNNWVVQCEDSFIEMSMEMSDICKNRGGIKKYLKWVDG